MTTATERLRPAAAGCMRGKTARIWLLLALAPTLPAQNAAQTPAPSARASPAARIAPSEAWGSQTFDVKYVDPERLREIFSGRSFVMEANRDLKCLTAHGSPAVLKEVEETVKRFDVAPPLPANIQITVYLLTVAAQAPSGGALPPELAATGKELTAAGSPPLRLADSQMVRVREGQPGDATGSASAPDGATLVRIKLQSASISPSPKGDTISLNGLRVWLNVPSTPEINRSQPKMDADISADIDIEQNRAVMVAKAGIDKPEIVIVRASIVR